MKIPLLYDTPEGGQHEGSSVLGFYKSGLS